MMKKDILANLNQKSLIFYFKTPLNVFHNTSITVLLPCQHTGFQTSPILTTFLATYNICQWCLICMNFQAYKYVSQSLWHHLMFFKLKITNILKSCGRGCKRVSCHGNTIFFRAGKTCNQEEIVQGMPRKKLPHFKCSNFTPHISPF